MSGQFTDSASRATLSWLVGNTIPSGWTPATNTYLALLTSDPRVTVVNGVTVFDNDPTVSDIVAVEFTATGYSRKQVTWSASQTNTGNPSSTNNSTQLTYGPFTDASGSGAATTFGALVTSASGSTGNVIHVWEWDNPVSAAQNESVVISVGNLTMTLQ